MRTPMDAHRPAPEPIADPNQTRWAIALALATLVAILALATLATLDRMGLDHIEHTEFLPG
jgi:hypothetical protein